MEKMHIKLNVNGKDVDLLTEPRTLLIHALREELGITGPHIGCSSSHCGACTVDMNGMSVKSCTVFAAQANGAEITTIEGLGSPDGLHVLQEMRLLHTGHDHPCASPASGKSEPDRGRGAFWHRRQSLPLHRLPEHCESHPRRRREDE